MKIELILIVFWVGLLGSCQTAISDKEETILSSDSLGIAIKDTNQNSILSVEIADKAIDKEDLIKSRAVGQFEVGEVIHFPETSDNYTIKKETLVRMTEEGEEEQTIYIVNQGGEDKLHLKLAYDYEKEIYLSEIGEIIVLSNDFRTLEGIGVNSTLMDFVAAYPDYKIWYTYVSGMYVLESPKLEAQFILNQADFLGKIDAAAEMVFLQKEDFKTDSKILKIRLF